MKPMTLHTTSSLWHTVVKKAGIGRWMDKTYLTAQAVTDWPDPLMTTRVPTVAKAPSDVSSMRGRTAPCGRVSLLPAASAAPCIPVNACMVRNSVADLIRWIHAMVSVCRLPNATHNGHF